MGVSWYFFVGAIIVVKLVLNMANALYLIVRKDLYTDWLLKKADIDPLLRSKRRTISLFKQAGVHDMGLPIAQPAGYGMISAHSIGVFDQYPTNIEGLVGATLRAFEEAIGAFKSRAIDAINPLYWISLVIYLPTKSLGAVGVNSEKALAKVLQGLYWLLGVAAGVLWLFARSFVVEQLSKLLDSLS